MTIPSPTDENISKKPDSLTAQKRHSFVRRLKLTSVDSTSSRLRIARHHFHPKIVTSTGKIFLHVRWSMLMYVTCELSTAFMRFSSDAGRAREKKKRPLFVIARRRKRTPAFVGPLVQWLLRCMDLVAAGGMSDTGTSFRY